MVARAGVRRLQAFDVLNHLLLLLIGLACFYPLMHVLSLSLSSERAIVQGITWFPRDIDLISYKFMLTHHRILGGYANTILYTGDRHLHQRGDDRDDRLSVVEAPAVRPHADHVHDGVHHATSPAA